MKLIPILFFSILLIGCSRSTKLECQNITINNTIEVIKYINNTTIKEVNITCDKEQKELELIRRLKFLEGQQDRYFNYSDCNDDIVKCRFEINESIEDLERAENRSKECEEELCDINSSWC